MAKQKASRKRRGRGEGGVTFREDRQLWEGSISLGTKPDGSRNRLRVFAGSKAEVLEKMARLKAEARAGSLPDASGITVSQLLVRWLEANRERLAPRTHENREVSANEQIIPALGNVRLAALTALHVEGMAADLSRAGVGVESRRRAVKVLRTALNHALRYRLIASNVSVAVPLPIAPRREMLTLDAMGCKVLLAAAAGRSIADLVTTALGSGCRRGELLAAGWDDIDLEKGLLHVRRSLTWTKAGGYVLKEPKSAAARRTVSLPPFAVEALKMRRLARLKAGLIARPVFSTSTGSYLAGTNIVRAMRALVARANRDAEAIPPAFRFHDLRHTVASLLLSQGQSLKAVSTRLGHSDPAVTLRIYSHCLPGDDGRLADGLERLIG